jgi:hypothetical protein
MTASNVSDFRPNLARRSRVVLVTLRLVMLSKYPRGILFIHAILGLCHFGAAQRGTLKISASFRPNRMQ